MVRSSGAGVGLACSSGSVTDSCVSAKLQLSVLSDGCRCADQGTVAALSGVAHIKHRALP